MRFLASLLEKVKGCPSFYGVVLREVEKMTNASDSDFETDFSARAMSRGTLYSRSVTREGHEGHAHPPKNFDFGF